MIFSKNLFRPLRDRIVPQEQHIDKRSMLFLLIMVFGAVTICSKSSPLYPLNNWDDANCFFTVGKSIANGRVLYQDIFEQKGPLLYFLYSGAYMISHNSFFGAYLLEILTGWCFVMLSAKTMLLFCDKKSLFLLPVLALTVCAAPAFEQGGSAEEICLPLLMYSVYIGAKTIVYDKPVRKREWLVIGITSGAVLWIKFTLLGYYFGFGLFMLFYYALNRWGKELVYFLTFLLMGELIISVPVFLYFMAHNALAYLFEVYFYCNIFLYSVTTVDNKFLGLFLNLRTGFVSYLYNFWISLLMIIIGGIFVFLRSKRLATLYCTTVVTTFVLVYMGGRCYTYYPLVMAVFMPFGLVTLYKMLISSGKKWPSSAPARTGAVAGLTGLWGILLLLISPNTYMIGYSKEQLPQYRFNDIISQKDNATLLNYKFLDGGFYTVSETVPDCRFFCELNMPYARREQEKYITETEADYIVTRDYYVDFREYELISTERFETRQDTYNTYYLYQKKSV